MSITDTIQKSVSKTVKELYDLEVPSDKILVNLTRKQFEGDYTVVVFPFKKAAGKKVDIIGEELGNSLVSRVGEVAKFNVIKGFLNLSLSEEYWKKFLFEVAENERYGARPSTGEKVMVEFSSPNTNKPLHLGHIRNILLGWSCSKILEAFGHQVIKAQIVNDRGIAICRSMLAWKKFSNGETPENTGMKPDHFVGKYYVEFSRRFKEEYETWQSSEEAGQVYEKRKAPKQSKEEFFKIFKNSYFNEYSKLGKEAKDMLLKWEAGDEEVRALWNKMNNWVYEGFEKTYKNLGVTFDKLYYESDTYLLGKEMVDKGLEKGIFQKDGKRVWIDLEDVNLGKKTIIKSDGTSTYTSQDMGTARIRYDDYEVEKMVYVVADEQNNHFQVLFEILKRLEEPYANGLYHLSYGMVDLPTGKMKSREGTVVDADDLVAEVIEEARKEAAERGDITQMDSRKQSDLLRKIGLAALKYFIIKVNPKKRMIFDPKASVDLQGQTGPYIQYSYVRINGVLNRAEQEGVDFGKAKGHRDIQPQELDLLQQLHEFPNQIEAAAQELDPSIIANFCYALAKSYHKFWHDLSFFGADTKEATAFRLVLSKAVGQALKMGMGLLGIEMPERM